MGNNTENNETSLLFVYGTLQRGQGNHCFLEHARFCGEAQTEASYTMVDCGAFPALVHNGKDSVRGEVFEITGEILESIDRLEGHPRFYKRGLVSLTDGRKVVTYFMPAEMSSRYARIPGGSWPEREDVTPLEASDLNPGQEITVIADGIKATIQLIDREWASTKILIRFSEPHPRLGGELYTKYFHIPIPGELHWGHDGEIVSLWRERKPVQK